MKSLARAIYVLCLLGTTVGASITPPEYRILLLIPFAAGTAAALIVDRVGALDSASCLMLLGLAGTRLAGHILIGAALMVPALLGVVYVIGAHRKRVALDTRAGLAMLALDAVACVASALI